MMCYSHDVIIVVIHSLLSLLRPLQALRNCVSIIFHTFLSCFLVACNGHSRNNFSIHDLILFTIICVLSFDLFVVQGGYIHEISAL